MKKLTKKYFKDLINSNKIFIETNINRELYCFGHKCKVLSNKTLSFPHGDISIGFDDASKELITLSNFELEQYFKLGFTALHWFMFKRDQIEKYIDEINSPILLTLYADVLDENILEAYFDKLFDTFLGSNCNINSKIIHWVIKNKLHNITDNDFSRMIKKYKVSEDIINENLDKFNYSNISNILKYQSLSEETQQNLKLLEKLYKN